jgi:hypothetical protein
MNNLYYANFKKNSLSYLLLFLKPGKRNKQVNDLRKLNLKGKVKRYEKIITEPNSTAAYREIYLFNEQGFLLEEDLLKGKEKIKRLYQYFNENTISSCIVYNEKDEEIQSAFYEYDKNWKLLHKTFFETKYNSYDEYYSYDLRNNIILQERYYEESCVVDIYDYNYYGELINTYTYEENKMVRHIKNIKYFVNHKIIKESFVLMPDGGVFSKTTKYYNSNQDIMVKTLASFNLIREIETTYVYTYNNQSEKYYSEKNDNWVKKQKFHSSLVETIISKIDYFD